MLPSPPRSTLFPYTTLFRSLPSKAHAADANHARRSPVELQPHDSQLLRFEWLRARRGLRSEEHTSELQSHSDLVCRLLLEKKTQLRAVTACHQETHLEPGPR